MSVARREAKRLDELERIERLRQALFISVNHEMRTPMTSIVGSAEVLLDDEGLGGNLTRDQIALISGVRRNAQRLLRLIDNLHALARLDHDWKVVNIAAVPLSKVVETAVAEATPLLSDRQQDLRVQIGQDETLTGDFAQLVKMLANLLINAAKFSSPRGEIALSSEHRRVAGQEHVAIEIADHGQGTCPDERTEIFRCFARGRDAVTGQIPGIGIGLYIAEAIAKLHGGSISLRENESRGSVLTILLPLENDAPKPQSEGLRQLGAG